MRRLRLSYAIRAKNPPLWLPFVRRHQPQSIVLILSWPRSGSTWLHTMLAAHPNVYSYGEVPDEADFSSYTFSRLKQLYPDKVSHLVFKYLTDGKEASDIAQFVQSLYARGIQVYPIILYRENILANYYSLRMAEKTGQWSAGALDKRPEKSLRHLTLAAQALQDYFECYESEYQALQKALKNQAYVLSYEQLQSHSEEYKSAIQSYLQLEYYPIYSLLVKQNEQPLSEVIENYEALKQYFAPTKWSVFFND